MTADIKSSSFAVALSPEFNEDNEWTGEVTAFIEEEIGDDLNEEEVAQIRSVCNLLASCLGLMEEDRDFLQYIKAYFISNCEEMLSELVEDMEDKPNFTKDGNVFTLNFNTKTHGSA